MTNESTIRARDVCCFTSRQAGVLYDIANDVSTVLKVTGKRVPGDIASTSVADLLEMWVVQHTLLRVVMEELSLNLHKMCHHKLLKV